MKGNKILRIKMLYIKALLKLYKFTKNTFPVISKALRKHIEKSSLKNNKKIYNIISNNNT
jgi:hypothetical protein